MNQVSDYERILKGLNLEVDKVLFIDIDKETGLKRILGRVSCPVCKKSYNTLSGYMTPKVEGLCDDCKVALVSRTDDTEASYGVRYDIYMNETRPVIDYYDKLGKLIKIDGTNINKATPPNVYKIVFFLLCFVSSSPIMN